MAKQELDCETILSCKEFCSQEANYLKCQSFAQKHGLSPPPQNDEGLLSKAKENLNCDSTESCKALCDKQENYTKCAALLQDQIASDEQAMFEKYKPLIKEYLGCSSIVTCMAFCINPLNTKKCQELAERIEVEQGGISSPESPDPEVWCPKVSSECSWDGTNCVCQGPQTCTQSNDIPGCTWDGTQCNCPGIYQESPEIWCPKAGPGCAWDGKNCVCPGTEGPTGAAPNEPGDVWCPRIGPYCVFDGSSCTCWDECVKSGGTWTGQTCEPPQGTTTVQPNQVYPTPESPEASCIKNPDCKWTGETCQCSAVLAPQPEPSPTVQGTSTSRNLLQQIWDLLF